MPIPLKPEKTVHHFRRWTAIFLAVGLILGCAGGRSALEPPAHLRAGKSDAAKGAELYRKGCHAAALEQFFTAHRKFRAADRLADSASALNNIGTVYRATGDAETALLFFQESRTLFDRVGNIDGAIQALANAAAALMDLERLDEAGALLDKAESLLPGPSAPAYLIKNRGILAMKRDRTEEAETLLRQALERTASDDAGARGAIFSALGDLMGRTGRPNAAAENYRAALEADRTAGNHRGMADDLLALADLAPTPAEEIALLKRSIQIYALMENRETVSGIMDRLEKRAAEAGIGIDLTRHFVETWLSDPSGWTPCR